MSALPRSALDVRRIAADSQIFIGFSNCRASSGLLVWHWRHGQSPNLLPNYRFFSRGGPNDPLNALLRRW
jgi:hypothetical protein